MRQIKVGSMTGGGGVGNEWDQGREYDGSGMRRIKVGSMTGGGK